MQACDNAIIIKTPYKCFPPRWCAEREKRLDSIGSVSRVGKDKNVGLIKASTEKNDEPNTVPLTGLQCGEEIGGWPKRPMIRKVHII